MPSLNFSSLAAQKGAGAGASSAGGSLQHSSGAQHRHELDSAMDDKHDPPSMPTSAVGVLSPSARFSPRTSLPPLKLPPLQLPQ